MQLFTMCTKSTVHYMQSYMYSLQSSIPLFISFISLHCCQQVSDHWQIHNCQNIKWTVLFTIAGLFKLFCNAHLRCYKNGYPDAVHTSVGFSVSPFHTDTAILAKETEFQDDGEDNIHKFLEFHSVPLRNDELAELDM